MNRRQFIGAGAFSAAALATPGVFAAIGPATRKLGPNELPTVAMIGMGKQGRGLLNQFLGQKVVVARICDCDKVRREDAVKRVQDFYEAHKERGVPRDACRGESDFRKIIDDPTIDMVCIATPDHWHAYMTVECMKHGKDVYCEKPLTYSVDEARVVVEVARRTGRILQTGAMQRSGFEFFTACEMVRNGVIGKVKYVENHFGGPASPRRPYKDIKKWQEEGAPNPDVDFNMWLGPAPGCPYSDQLAPRGVHDFFPGFWREDDFFGSGGCGDWGAHHMDITHWGMGLDGSGPVKVLSSREKPHWAWDRGFRRQCGARLVYADGLTVKHVGEDTRWGTVFFGSRGILCVDRGRFALWSGDASGLEVTPEVRRAISDGTFAAAGFKKVAYYADKYKVKVDGVEKEVNTATEQYGQSAQNALKIATGRLGIKLLEEKKMGYDFKTKLYRSESHVKNFVECFHSRQATISNEDVGPWTSVLCQLVHMSYIHDVGFDWDPAKMTFANGTGNVEWLSRLEVRPNPNKRYEVKA